MLNSKAYRLLDVGGTFVKCADGRQVPIPSDGSREEIAAALAKAVGPLDGVKGIGVAIPGPFDYREGVFRMEHKFAAVKDLTFRTLACVPEGIPLRFGHDVNTLLLCSVRMLGLKNAAVVTLGTGLGFSYYTDGKVHVNEKGSPARNLWNLPYGEGILEDVISARGIRNAYREKTGDGSQSAYTVAKLAFGGDIPALEVYDHVGSVLGEFLKDTLPDIRTDTLLVGGQISKSLSLMLRPLQNALEGIAILPVPEGAVFEGLSALLEPTTVY